MLKGQASNSFKVIPIGTRFDLLVAAVEKLKVLLDEKVAQLGAREEQLNRLTVSTQGLKNQIEGIQEALKTIESNTADGSANGQGSGGGLTPAILRLIESTGTAPGLLPSEIVEYLLQHGFNRDKRQLYASVYPLCSALAKKGRIKEGTKVGKRSFMRNQPV